jgi:hypothetical protein
LPLCQVQRSTDGCANDALFAAAPLRPDSHPGGAFTAFVALIRQTPFRRYRRCRYHCLTVDGWATG